ncbi:phage virion morphogenesis protein [Burkholderia pseudomallei]|uniref:Uncharacterized protein n=4 Tax=Burkholderia pseudomallei TaxID=28450 RepID=Q63RV0_BURPS|nr:hypothetical protein [Burkholderia pseudomallei]AJX27465.1 hypothetical protein AQ15_2374 [Burkholderia pseudomallei K96243]EIF70746.1 hypothetical protein BP354E_5099 [Burkholderia pseudomallei 354e]EIF71991.1 hypothetical protein BP354A_6220 [Burkholderia pseudomallei 354a]MBD2945572.1 hypothetical protein [Burkholderia pseudomallei]MBD2952224.1 hypothetical protein [Burkholderia pseudomallei]
MKISGDIKGASIVERRIGEIPSGIRTALEKKISELAVRLQTHVVNDKLRGQVLNYRSGMLSRRVAQAVVESGDGTSITGIVSDYAEYAAIHEYGGIIRRMSKPGVARLRIDARGNLLRQGDKGSLANLAVFAKERHKRVREVSYKGGKPYIIKMPERSFLRSALADMREEILEEIEQAVAKALPK